MVAGEAALELGVSARLAELLAAVKVPSPGRHDTFPRGARGAFPCATGRQRRAAAAEQGFREAAALFREIGMPFYLAVLQLEHAELLAAVSRSDECGPLLTEGRETVRAAAVRPPGSSASTRSASAPRRSPDTRPAQPAREPRRREDAPVGEDRHRLVAASRRRPLRPRAAPSRTRRSRRRRRSRARAGDRDRQHAGRRRVACAGRSRGRHARRRPDVATARSLASTTVAMRSRSSGCWMPTRQTRSGSAPPRSRMSPPALTA